MSLPDRISAYRKYRLVRCTDPRWEAILTDLRAGVIRIDRAAECWLGRVEIV